MMEALWKVLETIIDTRIKMLVTFHDVLHGLCAIRGMGMAIIVSIDHDPILLMFLDLRKAYDTLYCGRILQTLKGYGKVPRMQGLLAEFWDDQEVFNR